MPNTKNAIGYPNADGSFGEIANNNPKYDGINAADVSFDNTGTGMSATNVQGAIGEVNSNLTSYPVTLLSDNYIIYCKHNGWCFITFIGYSNSNQTHFTLPSAMNCSTYASARCTTGSGYVCITRTALDIVFNDTVNIYVTLVYPYIS